MSGSLSALFGMLGYVFAKIEALKLIRAVLRNQEGFADGTFSLTLDFAHEKTTLSNLDSLRLNI